MHSLIKSVSILFLALTCFVCATSFAAATKTPLSVDQAFEFKTVVDHSNKVSAEWHIAPGYYLYRQRLQIKVDPDAGVNIKYPQGEYKYDADQGRYEVFSGNLSIPVLLKTKAQKLRMTVEYQGCSEEGFCYPPMQKDITLNLSLATPPEDQNNKPLLTGQNDKPFQTLLTDQKGVQSLLHTQHFGISLLLFVGLGLLLAFTPCVFPMVPILTSIIVGQKKSSMRKSFLLSFSYVMGMSITYALAGVAIAALGNSLQVWLQTPWIIGTTSLVFVLLSLSLFGVYDLRLPRVLQNHVSFMSNKQQGGTYAGVFFMGVLATLIVSPCVTAPLVGVLLYIAQSGNLMLGASALFAMGIGMGIPLLLIGVSAGRWLPKSGPWMEVVKKMFALLMLGMAIWLAARILSTTVVVMLWGGLLVGIALFLALYLPRVVPLRNLHRSLGVLVGISGMFLMISAVSMPNVVNKWVNSGTMIAAQTFVEVHDLAGLNKELSEAQTAHRPVVLDFYADWCSSCVSMDRHVFANPKVQRNLHNYILLRADLSTKSHEAILKKFNVVAPPTVIFFDTSGHEMHSQRIVGEVNEKEFLARLKTVKSRFPTR